MKKVQKGFTLIELMIVIAIIGILAAIAIPQYQDYITRSKVTEGLNLSAAAKTAVAETYQTDGYVPATGNSASPNSFGLPINTSISGQYVESVTVAGGNVAGTGGVITVKYSAAEPKLNGLTLTLTPVTADAGSVAWICNGATISVNGTSYTGTAGTVPSKYLPANCR